MKEARLPPGPRERLLRLGEASLSDHECVSLVLGAHRCGRPVASVAEELMRRFGGVDGLEIASAEEIVLVEGVGAASAARLVAGFGLGRRALEAGWSRGRCMRGPSEVAALLRARVIGMRRECFQVVALDARHRVLSIRTVSIGHLTGAPVHPREVFAPAIACRAVAVVVAHNHPSGDPGPSEDDRRVTDRLREAGELLGIELLDHLVLGASAFYSFADGCERPFSPASSRAQPTRAAVSTRSVNAPRCTGTNP